MADAPTDPGKIVDPPKIIFSYVATTEPENYRERFKESPMLSAYTSYDAVQALAEAHGVTRRDAAFVQSIDGPAIGPFLYLGAKHMVTGYDHLLFLVGVIFFLYRLKDVLLYVSLFTIGHSLTLLGGVLGGIHANAYLIDAIIALSVVYKAFDNLSGFKSLFGIEFNQRWMVLIFGLFHGFGLAATFAVSDRQT